MPDPLIVHVLPAFVPYGAERVALELTARLPSRGFRTRIVSLFGGDGLQEEMRHRNIHFVSLARSRYVSRVHLVSLLRRILHEEGERAPAIVHTHLFGADFWTSLARFQAPLNRFTAKPRSAVSYPRFVSTSHNVDRDDSSLRRAARRWCMQRMDAVGAISEDVERYTHEDLGVPQDRIRLIPNGIDLTLVGTRGARSFRETPSLLMVGRLEPQKGHAVALRALADVPAPWTLKIAGGGSRKRELKELAEKLGIASRVHFLGEQRDVSALMREADLFLFPSQWEGMGMALVEAVAAGVPALASDLPALRELLPDDRLVDPLEPAAWTRAIREVLANPAATLARAEHLAPEARKRYDVEGMVDRYVSLYRDLLNR